MLVGIAARQSLADDGHERLRIRRRGELPSLGPAGDLPSDEAVGSSEVTEADRIRVDKV